MHYENINSVVFNNVIVSNLSVTVSTGLSKQTVIIVNYITIDFCVYHIVEYVPYTISVSAYTSTGRGNESKITAFIKEGGKNKYNIY